jgi:hypothetical protein
MPRISLTFAGLLLVLLVVACGQTYYSKSFRLSTEIPDQNAANFDRLIDGPLDPIGNSTLTLRMVALYSSNNQAKMTGNNFNILIEQRFPSRVVDTAQIDSMVVTFRPSGIAHSLRRESLRLYTGRSIPEPRLRTKFGALEIPVGVDTVQVQFAAVSKRGTSGETTKAYELTLIRWEGSYGKFGIMPLDKD